MRRDLIAIVPVRGAHWTGLTAVTTCRFSSEAMPLTAVCVRLRATLDGATWMPGEPDERFAGLFEGAPPRPDDGVPIKGSADLVVSYEGAESLRDHHVDVVTASVPRRVDPADEHRGPARFVEGSSVLLRRDLESFRSAPSAARALVFGPDLAWSIDGAEAARGALGFQLGVRADFLDGASVLVPMKVDTARILLAERAVELSFRGRVLDGTARLLDRVVVGVLPGSEPLAAERVHELLDAALPGAWFGLAANVEDAFERRRPPALDDTRRAAARASALGDGPGEPSITPDEYRAIRSSLQREPRADVLARHGFDELAWAREEWAVGELLARAGHETVMGALADDDESADRQSEMASTMEAWTAALRPEVDAGAIDLEAFARVSAHMAEREPGKVLAEVGLTAAEYIAIEDAATGRLERDDDARARFEERFAVHREEAAARAEEDERASFDDDDDETAEAGR